MCNQKEIAIKRKNNEANDNIITDTSQFVLRINVQYVQCM